MKKFTYLFSLTVTAFLLAFAVITGCEGPAGSDGTDGLAGADGIDGINGINGTDGTAACVACHNDETTVLAKSLQSGVSKHQTGGHWRYGDDTECSVCHTHEGFLDVLASGLAVADAEYLDATGPTCRTCHMIHDQFTTDDFDLRVTGAVNLWFNDVDVDLGTSNMCVTCHQPRHTGDLDVLPVSGGADIVIDDDGWGYPHQSQSSIVYGTGGYEIAGTEDYAASAAGASTHAAAGCVGCHMAAPYGTRAGGHTMILSYDGHYGPGYHTESCETSGCHSSVDDFDYLNIQTDVADLWDSLEVILHKKSVSGDSIMIDGDLNASSGSPLTLTPDEAGAYLNLMMVDREKSGGVHNPGYIRALLKNSIQAMD